MIHVGYISANVEQVFFPHAEVIGDIGSSLPLLADRLEGRLDRSCDPDCGRKSWGTSTSGPRTSASR